LIAGWTKFEDEYEQLRTQFKEGPLSANQTDALLDKWADQIRAAIIEADEMHNDAVSVSNWESAITTLKTQLEFARNN